MKEFKIFFIVLTIIIMIRGGEFISLATENNSSFVMNNITTWQNNDTDYVYGNNSNVYDVVLPEIEDTNDSILNSIIYVYNTSIKIKELEIVKKLPSVFDLSSYNNTCNGTSEQRLCFIQQNSTEEEEVELCRHYVNIIRLAYDFSCLENVPGDQLINASSNYIQKLAHFLKNQESMRGYYTQSIQDALKMSKLVEMADIQAAQGVKAYSLPHSPTENFNLVPNEIPVLYEEHNTYIIELKKYLNLSVNVINYISENNLINIFPYLYEILLGIAQYEETNLSEGLVTLADLEYLFKKYNEFNDAYRIFDIVVLGMAGILFLVGMVLNVILLAVFIRFKDTRTYANATLINLVVIDCISIVFNLLVYYVIDRLFYHFTSCTVLSFLIVIRHVSYIVSVYTLVIISFQRYRAVSQTFKPSRCTLGVRATTTITIFGIWALAMIYSLPNLVFVEYNDGDCAYYLGKYGKMMLAIQFCMLCILPVILVSIFSAMASYKLRESIKTLPGERMGLQMRIQQRTVSSRVLLGLIFLSVISYLPTHIASFVLYFSSDDVSINLFRTPSANQYADAILYNFMYINSCFNPLAIYFLSTKFKKHFHEIICVWKSQDNTKTLTDSTRL